MKFVICQKNKSPRTEEFSRKNLAKHLGNNPREIKAAFSVRHITSLSPKQDIIVFSLGNIKGIITKDSLYISPEDHPITQNIINNIGTFSTSEASSFLFYLLDTLLAQHIKNIRKNFEQTQVTTNQILQKLSKGLSDKYLERLLKIRKNISNLRTTTQSIEDELENIIEDAREMENFYLSKTAPKDIEEIESMLELFLEQAEEISHNIEELENHVESTQEIIILKLNNRRNIIIRFDLITTIITSVIATMTLITGLYGMNIKNNLEQSSSAFWWISGIIFIGLIVALFFFRYYLGKKNIL